MLTSAIAVGAVCVMGKGIKERHPAVKSREVNEVALKR